MDLDQHKDLPEDTIIDKLPLQPGDRVLVKNKKYEKQLIKVQVGAHPLSGGNATLPTNLSVSTMPATDKMDDHSMDISPIQEDPFEWYLLPIEPKPPTSVVPEERYTRNYRQSRNHSRRLPVLAFCTLLRSQLLTRVERVWLA